LDFFTIRGIVVFVLDFFTIRGIVVFVTLITYSF